MRPGGADPAVRVLPGGTRLRQKTCVLQGLQRLSSVGGKFALRRSFKVARGPPPPWRACLSGCDRTGPPALSGTCGTFGGDLIHHGATLHAPSFTPGLWPTHDHLSPIWEEAMDRGRFTSPPPPVLLHVNQSTHPWHSCLQPVLWPFFELRVQRVQHVSMVGVVGAQCTLHTDQRACAFSCYLCAFDSGPEACTAGRWRQLLLHSDARASCNLLGLRSRLLGILPLRAS